MPKWHFSFDKILNLVYIEIMNLKELRISKGLTQKQAIELLGIPSRTYKRYENEKEYVNSYKYRKIFEELKSYNNRLNNSKFNSKKIAVAGIGYVGLSIGTLLAQNNEVTMIDISKEKVNDINNRIVPFQDALIKRWFKTKNLNISATLDYRNTYANSDIVIIATPTNFDTKKNTFDTGSVELVYKQIRDANKECLIVIKSTVPIGFTKELSERFEDNNIIFIPEFLREGHALEDNLRPSRIIIGCDFMTKQAKEYGLLMKKAAIINSSILFMSSKEAESVKLFSNAYLAMRVAYFNELDTYAEMNGLSSDQIIKGISLDSRIGDQYNNPSFGYGGYCLPKDTEQLKSSFLDIPNSNLIKAIVESNQTRKEYIASQVAKIALQSSNKTINQITIGVYRLIMKTGSDNYRSSAVIDVINLLKKSGFNVLVYEKKQIELDFEVTNSLDDLKSKSDLIITNRYNAELSDYTGILYTRDLFARD